MIFNKPSFEGRVPLVRPLPSHRPQAGIWNTVSHSHRRSRRRWSPNIQQRTYYLPSEGRRIRLRVSTKGIKVIDRDGIEAVVARLRRQGQRI